MTVPAGKKCPRCDSIMKQIVGAQPGAIQLFLLLES